MSMRLRRVMFGSICRIRIFKVWLFPGNNDKGVHSHPHRSPNTTALATCLFLYSIVCSRTLALNLQMFTESHCSSDWPLLRMLHDIHFNTTRHHLLHIVSVVTSPHNSRSSLYSKYHLIICQGGEYHDIPLHYSHTTLISFYLPVLPAISQYPPCPNLLLSLHQAV